MQNKIIIISVNNGISVNEVLYEYLFGDSSLKKNSENKNILSFAH